VLKVPSLSQPRNVNEIIGKFGVSGQRRDDPNQLQTLLYME